MTLELFADDPALEPVEQTLAPGAVLLRGFGRASAESLLCAVDAVVGQAPLRYMSTPGGYRMSVAMTNCGVAGWITDATGYRYGPCDPDSGKQWPAMPAVLS